MEKSSKTTLNLRMGFLLISMSLISTSFLKAQSDSYIPMLEPNKEWTIVHIIYDPFLPDDSLVYLSKLRVGSDTIVDGKMYKKLFSNGPGVWLYREDTVAQQVYVRIPVIGPPEHEVDTLLFDMTWLAGDTVELYIDPGLSDNVISVTELDSILIETRYHKRLTMKIHDVEDSIFHIIEGIGKDRNWGGGCIDLPNST